MIPFSEEYRKFLEKRREEIDVTLHCVTLVELLSNEKLPPSGGFI